MFAKLPEKCISEKWEFIDHFLVKSANLLKMNFFMVVFKNFAYVLINELSICKFQEHLIAGTSFNG